jgi:hypothetical protein
MSIMQFFKKLAGGKAVDEYPVSDFWENRRRAFVRTGNLDWQGLPIDRDRAAGMSPPPGFRKLVSYFLERAGMKVERRQPPSGVQAVNGLGAISAIFNADAARQSAARGRRPPADQWLRQGESNYRWQK